MKKYNDLTGRVFDRLTVIFKEGSRNGNAVWLCLCSCGKSKAIRADSLMSGASKSCGCKLKESNIKNKTIHGKMNTSTYRSWKSLKHRCLNKDSSSYPYYGGRGISICQRWYEFSNFISDMGERPEGCSIDRIDVNGDYCPENCRWATGKEQARNRRNNRVMRTDNGDMCLSEAIEFYGETKRKLISRFDSHDK